MYTNKLFLFCSRWCLAVTARYGGYDPGYDPGLIWFSTHFSEVAEVFTEICWLPETCTETSDVSIDLTCRTFFVQKVLKYIIKGPDNPTSQLLPIMSFKGCSGVGEGRKDKGGGERLCVKVCEKIVCMYVCMYIYMYVRTYVRMYVCMYIRTYVCMYVCMNVCMCMCVTKLRVWWCFFH